jgi:large subunit ribosomal protein L1
MSFPVENIVANTAEVLRMIEKLKPASAKGTYMKSVSVSSTMSLCVRIDAKTISK